MQVDMWLQFNITQFREASQQILQRLSSSLLALAEGVDFLDSVSTMSLSAFVLSISF